MLRQVRVQRTIRKQDAADELEEAVRNALEHGAVVEHNKRVQEAVADLLEAIEGVIDA